MTEVSKQDEPKLEAAKKKMAEDEERVKDSTEMNNKRMAARPTPTQEEANLSALGVPIVRHDDDGSGPEPVREVVFRQVEAKPGSPGYNTRTAAPSSGSHSGSAASGGAHAQPQHSSARPATRHPET
jgi:hypothetical protein